MSMNLFFSSISNNGIYIDFPFQTPTELTFKVIKAKTTVEQLAILKEYIDGFKCWNFAEKRRIWKRIKELMDSEIFVLRMG